jgi:4-amino-4-deoxy-L-arabinose transferase-like glycosyltransferase
MSVVIFRSKRIEIALTGIILFFVSANIFWFSSDLAPPMWDQSHYLLTSEHLYHTLTDQGILPFFDAYTNALGTKAPLITVLPIPLFHLFGDTYSSALYVNLLFLVVCSVYLYKLTSILSNKKSALLSVFILNSFPLAFAMSREFLVEYGLMTFVVAWMYHTLQLDANNRRADAYSLGLVLGLGMLMKFSFALYIAFPTLFLISLRAHELKRLPKDWISRLLAISFVAALVAGPWYFQNTLNIVKFVLSSGYGDFAKIYGTGDVFTLTAIKLYWISLINTGISFYYFLAFLVAAGIWVGSALVSTRHNEYSHVEAKYYLFLLIWLIVPFIVFTFAVNKDYRYILPILPALAISGGIAFSRLASHLNWPLLPSLLLIFPLFNYLYVSFAFPADLGDFKFGPFLLLGGSLAYAHPPRKESWPNVELLALIQRDVETGDRARDKILATFLFDHEYINRLTSNYYAANGKVNFEFETVDYYKEDPVEDIVKRISAYSDYLVTKTDKLGPDFSNVKNRQIKSIFDKGGLPFGYFAAVPLPDDTVLTLFKKSPSAFSTFEQPLVLESIGPTGTEPGKGFNQQPGGESAMWVEGENMTASTVIVFNNVPLHGYPSGKQNSITTPVPDTLFASPGEFPVYLLETKTGRSSNEIYFQVK